MGGFTPLETKLFKKKIRMSLTGFTLLEVLITVLLLAVVIAALYGVLNIANKTFPEDLGALDVHQQARQAMDWLVKETRQANASISITNPDSCNGRIGFNTPNGTDVQYYLDTSDANSDGRQDQIIREYPSGTYSVKANEISCLEFSSLASDLLQVKIEANKTVLQQPLSFALLQKVKIRKL